MEIASSQAARRALGMDFISIISIHLIYFPRAQAWISIRASRLILRVQPDSSALLVR